MALKLQDDGSPVLTKLPYICVMQEYPTQNIPNKEKYAGCIHKVVAKPLFKATLE